MILDHAIRPEATNGYGSRRAFVYLLLFVLSSSTVWAGPTGRISGVASDATGSPIGAARVSVTSTTMGIKATAVTDKRGVYSFLTLAPGSYDLEIKAKGFRPANRKGLMVHVDSILKVDISLETDESEPKA